MTIYIETFLMQNILINLCLLKLVETTTKDKMNIILQSYAIWQIEDQLSYHNSVVATGSVDSYLKNQNY